MNLIGKLQPLIILAAALSGLVLGNFTALGEVSTGLIEIFLMALLYILFLGINLKQLTKAWANLRYTFSSLFINFIITPLIAYGLGLIFFADSPAIRIGLLMLLITPCTDWYLVFTGLAKGNVELNLAILPLNLLLQIILLPVYLLIFMGSEIQIETFTLAQSIAVVLLLPFILAMLTKKICHSKREWQDFISRKSDNLQLLFLCLAVLIMFAGEGGSLWSNPILLLKMFIPLLIFLGLLLLIGQAVGRLLKFSKRDIIALNFTTLARNSPLALAITVAAFPEQPLISLSLIIGPLIELPILAIIAALLLRWQQAPSS